MPVAVLHGPCQAGQQAPLAGERQEPVQVTVLVAFCGVRGLPYCQIWLATGHTGAAKKKQYTGRGMPRLVMPAAGSPAELCFWLVC
jgi:hypothetical protein